MYTPPSIKELISVRSRSVMVPETEKHLVSTYPAAGFLVAMVGVPITAATLAGSTTVSLHNVAHCITGPSENMPPPVDPTHIGSAVIPEIVPAIAAVPAATRPAALVASAAPIPAAATEPVAIEEPNGLILLDPIIKEDPQFAPHLEISLCEVPP